MDNTTPFYDVYSGLYPDDYDTGPVNPEDFDTDPVHVCQRNGDNYLGAQLSILYFVLFVLSLVGNGLLLVIIYRFEKRTSMTNIFLVNLVVSDLIFMCSLPFWGIYQQLSTWVFSTSMCKIVGSAYFLGFYSSILFLTLLSFDQHLAVVYSLVAPRLRRQNYAIACCAGVWLLSCLACVKPIILHTVFTDFNNKQYCEEYPNNIGSSIIIKSVWMYLQLLLFFVLPLTVIIYCYVRVTITVVSSRIVARFRTVRMIFAIVLLFFVCWTPYNVVLLMHYFIGQSSTCENMQRLGYALQVTRNIAYLYYCISPILYSFVGRKFQRHLRQLLVKSIPCLRAILI